MALSDDQISRIWDAHTVPVFGKTGINPIVFARAIEAEVRKDYDALIRQMLEALEGVHQGEHHGGVDEAITAASAWLDGSAPGQAAQQSGPASSFDDPRVQVVYSILCAEDKPPVEEHWEGFVARRIVDALADLQAPQQAAPSRLGVVDLMRVVMMADERVRGRFLRGTTNWAAHIGAAVQGAVLCANGGRHEAPADQTAAHLRVLVDLLNRRPALNAELATAYAHWTSEVYDAMGAMHQPSANDGDAA